MVQPQMRRLKAVIKYGNYIPGKNISRIDNQSKIAL